MTDSQLQSSSTNRSARRPGVAVIAALVVLLVLLVGIAWLGQRGEEATTTTGAAPADHSPAGQAVPAEATATSRAGGSLSAPLAPAARPAAPAPGENDERIVFREDHGYEPQEFNLDRMQIFRNFMQSVESWTPQDFELKTRERAQLTGREAYEVYAYLRSCLGQPESLEQVEGRIDRIERRLGRLNPGEQDRMAEALLGEIDQLETSLTRCEGVGTDGTGIPLLHDWLTLSADLGFGQAQLAYHLSARWVLSMQTDTLFREPDRVLEYRNRAEDYLQAALRAGHPDALLEFARAIDDDIVFERDPAAIYAYAYAAEQGGGGMDEEAREFMERIEPELEPALLRDARDRGRALCERYCRP